MDLLEQSLSKAFINRKEIASQYDPKLIIIGTLDLPMGVVFHEGSTIIVILNGLRLLSKKDAEESKHKELVEVESRHRV